MCGLLSGTPSLGGRIDGRSGGGIKNRVKGV